MEISATPPSESIYVTTPAGSERLLRSWAIYLIGVYQRWVSPWKGFSCPHRLLHGGLSCSAHIKMLLEMEEDSVGTILSKSAERFRECGQSSDAIARQRGIARIRCFVIPCCFSL